MMIYNVIVCCHLSARVPTDACHPDYVTDICRGKRLDYDMYAWVIPAVETSDNEMFRCGLRMLSYLENLDCVSLGSEGP
jgi:hypothetical protein